MRFISSLLAMAATSFAASVPSSSVPPPSHFSSSASSRPVPPPISQACIDAQTKFLADNLACASSVSSLANVPFGNFTTTQLDSLCSSSGCLSSLNADLTAIDAGCHARFLNESVSDSAWAIKNSYSTFCTKDNSQQYCLVTMENDMNTINQQFGSWVASGSIPQSFVTSFCQPCIGNMFLSKDGDFHSDKMDGGGNKPPSGSSVQPNSNVPSWVSRTLRNPRDLYNFICSTDPIEGSCANDFVALVAEELSGNYTSNVVCSRCNSRVEELIDDRIGNSNLCSPRQHSCFDAAQDSINNILPACKSSIASGSCSTGCSNALSQAVSKAGCCLFPFLHDDAAQSILKVCPSFGPAAAAIQPCAAPVYQKPTKVFIELNFTNIVVSYAQVNMHALQAALKNDTIRLFGCRIDDIDLNWKGVSVNGTQASVSSLIVEIKVEAHDPVTASNLLSSVSSILSSFGFSFQFLSGSISTSAALKDPSVPAAAYSLSAQGLVQPGTPSSAASSVVTPWIFASLLGAMALMF